jgi:hypothetical protein
MSRKIELFFSGDELRRLMSGNLFCWEVDGVLMRIYRKDE